MPKNVGDLGKLIVAKGFKNCPKSNKSPNLVTLDGSSVILTSCANILHSFSRFFSFVCPVPFPGIVLLSSKEN